MTLPPKEANLFKLIVKSYETKQYKKGVKAADSILKKFPDHGETLSMKGLILNCMDKKTEAYELVKKGLKNDLKSHVCWHVYGLLYRSDREYREAIKCYRNALRIDSENIQILRDLSLLQAQMRDFSGFVETRRQLLTLKPNHRNNWIGFAIAHHCSGSPSMAIKILEAYEGTLEENFPPPNEKYEHGEMLLYKVMLHEENGELNEAYQELIKSEKLIVDKLGYKEEKGNILLKLERRDEAKEVYYSLLDINPDNYNYYFSLQSCLGLSKLDNGAYSDENVKSLQDLYTNLKIKYPYSSAVKRIPLDFLFGDDFELALKNYVVPFLRKGVPSVFSDIKSLYIQPGKARIIDKVFKELEENLSKFGSFDAESGKKETPSSFVWLYFLLAQHYDKLKQYETALEKINVAIKHTPTITDLYLFRGRIFKHTGDPEAAAASANEGRCLDLADRFLNSETVKRMLQADHISEAEKTAALFTKDGDQHDNLFDMQCMWYEICSGDSHFRQKSYGKALKKYLSVFKHYNDIVEDQFDFHTYCLRKMTLRAYISMLRFEDHLHSHEFFCKSAFGIIRSYLAIYDSPPKSSPQDSLENSNLTAAERKRLKQKQKKEEARKKEAEEKLKEEAAQKAKKGLSTKPVDDDPDGEKLVSVEDPLAETIKHITLLQAHASKRMETHVLAFEVYFRKKKWLLVLQSLKRMRSLDSSHPDVHRCMIRFFYSIKSETFNSDPRGRLLSSVIESETTEMGIDSSEDGLKKLNNKFLELHNDSLCHRVAAAEMLAFISPDQIAQAIHIIETSEEKTSLSDDVYPGTLLWNLQDCISVHHLLLDKLKDKEAAERWKSRCALLFPRSNHFGGELSSSVRGLSKEELVSDDSMIASEFDVDFDAPVGDSSPESTIINSSKKSFLNQQNGSRTNIEGKAVKA